MLKKTITFKDLDGNSLTEDFYFNLSKAQLFEMQASEKGGLQEKLQEMIAEEDGRQILRLLNDVVKESYGVRSEDGRRFIQTQEVWEAFEQSDAHSELLFELYTDGEKSAAFMRGIVPSEVGEKMEDYSEMSAEEIRAKALESMQGHKKPQS